MSAKHRELTPELLARILPALRMMVRFPSRPAKVVSFETGIELADIYAYTEAKGRPKAADLEAIQAAIKEGVAPTPEPVVSAAPAKCLGVVLAPVPPASVEAAADGLLPGCRSPALVRVARILVAMPHVSEAHACRQVGLGQASWCAFKVRQWGKGPVPREKLALWVTGAQPLPKPDQSGQGAPAGAKSVAPAAPVAPAAAAAPAVPKVAAPKGPPKTPRHTAPDSARNPEGQTMTLHVPAGTGPFRIRLVLEVIPEAAS